MSKANQVMSGNRPSDREEMPRTKGAGLAGLAAAREGESPKLPDIPMPPLDEVNTMLELLMEDLNLSEDKKKVLRELQPDKKWTMLQTHLAERYDQGGLDASIAEEVKVLRNNPTKESLNSLSVSLRSKPIRWINNFIENEGLTLLLDNLKQVEDGEGDL